VILRTRRTLAGHGVQPALAAARRIIPLGQALAAAVEAAEQAEGDERIRALTEVARIGEKLSADINEQWEGLRSVVGELLDGIRGTKSRRPYG
jgi:hypothetical protein